VLFSVAVDTEFKLSHISCVNYF